LRVVILLWVFLLALFRIQLSFLGYLDFIYEKKKIVTAKVVNQYKKKNYYVLKLKNNEVSFYTTSRDNLKNLLNETIKLNILTDKISFLGYLTTFYAPSYNLKLKPINFIEEYIERQHKSTEMSNLFKALFLGESLEHQTRVKLSTLGISHLFALSGLHLGFISFLLFLIISPVYKIFHQKYPYRNKYVDIGIIVLVVEFLYLKFTNFPPSLIRAFVLEVVLFIFFYTLREIMSFKVLFLTLIVSFFIFFTKILSIGFLLSIAGVFYIYLFFNYFKFSFFNSIVLSFYMFLVMFIFSHTFFGNMNNFQLFSPIVNLLFSLFYPLEVFLHLIGLGGLLDKFVLWYLDFGEKFYYVNISVYFLIFFVCLSFIAIKKKWAFYGINLISLIVLIGSIKF